MKPAALGLGLAVVTLGSGCDRPTVPTDPPLVPAIDDMLRQEFQRWGVIPIASMPAEHPALVDLGQALFFDKILSGNRDISCATCHHPLTHGADGLSLAIGTGGTGLGPSRTLGPGRQFVPRNAPTMLNQGLRPQYLFWDGRLTGFPGGPILAPLDVRLPPVANILAAQAMLPVLNRREMRGEPGDVDVFGNPNELAQFADSQYVQVWQAIMQRLLAIPEYRAKFNAAFTGRPLEQLGFQHATAAIASFLTQAFTRTKSPLDRFLARDDEALTPEAKRGALLFVGRARSVTCHNGPLLGGANFASVGVPQLGPGTGPEPPLDLGRGGLPGIHQPGQTFSPYRFHFRVAPLRNVGLTAPYMHSGAYATLEAVVRHYNDVPTALRTYDVTQLSPALRGMYHGDAATINAILNSLDPRLREPLRLDADEQRDLVEFLRSLTDPAARDLGSLIPTRVPSGLPLQN